MDDKFWLWAAAAAFVAAIAVAAVYALALVHECERQHGVMVRSFSASGWSCVTGPQQAQAPR
jgi:hypothetical protein